MTPRGRWSPRDGDNTPQGKIASGCAVFFWWILAVVILAGLADVLENWVKG